MVIIHSYVKLPEGKTCLACTSRAFGFPFCSVTPSKQSHKPCRAGTHRLSLPLRQGMDDTRVTGNLYCFVQDLALAIPNRLLFLFFFFGGGEKTVISTSSILRIPNFHRTWESSRQMSVRRWMHWFMASRATSTASSMQVRQPRAMMGLESLARPLRATRCQD